MTLAGRRYTHAHGIGPGFEARDGRPPEGLQGDAFARLHGVRGALPAHAFVLGICGGVLLAARGLGRGLDGSGAVVALPARRIARG